MKSGCIHGFSFAELDLGATLRSGQVFRFTFDKGENLWRGVIQGDRVLLLSQSEAGDRLFWQTDAPMGEIAVREFLRLDDFRLAEAAEGWRRKDGAFAKAWLQQKGVRLLRQEPNECFFSFLCASVAPIARISGMLRAVATSLGTPLAEGLTAFPTAAQIAASDEETLRGLGMGFRAKRVILAAEMLTRMPADALSGLREKSHIEAKRELLLFFGVGEKIADCVSLFALDKDAAIPVDTHIWRMAQQHYAPELAGRSLTPANYARTVDAFVEMFGDHAGWAQQILFYRAAVLKEQVGKTSG